LYELILTAIAVCVKLELVNMINTKEMIHQNIFQKSIKKNIKCELLVLS